jgi:hypothetical protein
VIKFYKPNIMDFRNEAATISVTDTVASNNGALFTQFLRNRNNNSGWATTGSDDSANTELEFLFNDFREFDSIMLVLHNFKDFTIEWFDGAVWTLLETVTDNDKSTNYFEYDNLIEAAGIRVIVQATQTPDSDKFMRQFIVTEKIGDFEIEPLLRVEIDKQRKTSPYLSGRRFVSSQVGGISIRMSQNGVFRENDLAIIERLYDFFQGFLVSVSGGDIDQYETLRFGYRPEDIYYMQCANEYEPNWNDGRYKQGINITVDLVETN